jgi:hypothetical protein
MLTPAATLMLEIILLSAVHKFFFNIFAATADILRLSPPSATHHAMVIGDAFNMAKVITHINCHTQLVFLLQPKYK